MKKSHLALVLSYTSLTPAVLPSFLLCPFLENLRLNQVISNFFRFRPFFLLSSDIHPNNLGLQHGFATRIQLQHHITPLSIP